MEWESISLMGLPIHFSVHPYLISKSYTYSRNSFIARLWLRANFPPPNLLIDYKKIQFSTRYRRRLGNYNSFQFDVLASLSGVLLLITTVFTHFRSMLKTVFMTIFNLHNTIELIVQHDKEVKREGVMETTRELHNSLVFWWPRNLWTIKSADCSTIFFLSVVSKVKIGPVSKQSTLVAHEKSTLHHVLFLFISAFIWRSRFFDA